MENQKISELKPPDKSGTMRKRGAFLFAVLQHSIHRIYKEEHRFFGICADIHDDENSILKK